MISKEIIEEIKRQIKFECSIKMMEGASVKEKHKEWFLNRKADLDMKYWNRYRTYLIDKGFSVNVVNKMDDILDKLTAQSNHLVLIFPT